MSRCRFGITSDSQVKAKLIVDARDTIGEGPTWHGAQGRVLWSDNKIGLIHEAKPDGAGGWRETRQWNVGRRVGAAVPRSRGGLIVATGTEFITLGEDGTQTFFARLDVDSRHFHLNDAKCDPQGRLWAGTLDSDINVPGRIITPGRGALYRLDPDGLLTTMINGVTVSNGLAWSPDGGTLYYIDSYARRVDGFDFDGTTGTITGRRPIVVFGVGDGIPDGMTVDSEGCLWVAVIGMGEVRRYAHDGQLVSRVELETPVPTSCAFGGIDGSELFITSARVRLPDTASSTLTHGFSVEPDNSIGMRGAGGLYVCRPGVTGPPAQDFAG
jgi:sugar lactone lactonase YvrE